MKNSKTHIKTLFCTLLLAMFLIACDNDELLEEVPKSFLSPENGFADLEGFEAAVANLHRLTRGLRTSDRLSGEGDKAITAVYGSGTDLGWYWDEKLFFGDYNLINSTTALPRDYWNLLFGIIKDANVIISRLETSPLSDEEKLSIEARGRFFRAFAYRFLVYLYGDVPIVTEEIAGPKLDFIRAPKNEVISLIAEDLEFATQHLEIVNPGDGRLSKAAADHVLAETYISAGDFDKAIAAATRVIDDGQYALMTARYGTFSDRPGDVFWDMFRLGNQNRSSGNTEAIWVWQMEFGVPGGSARYQFERAWGPLIERLVDSENNKAIIPHDTLGRGVGFFRPSPYLETALWESDFSNDIRNSKYNMQRVFYNNNPDSPEFREVIVPRESDLARHHFVWLKKASNPHGHPQGYDRGGQLFNDIYAIRLAETYLLRAEAYLMKGDKVSAASDINVVRARSQASPVAGAEVDIDYILDERARELAGEEPRRLTLARLGLLYDRVKKYNAVSASTIQPFHNLWPIPQNEIDANSQEKLQQNPGYQ